MSAIVLSCAGIVPVKAFLLRCLRGQQSHRQSCRSPPTAVLTADHDPPPNGIQTLLSYTYSSVRPVSALISGASGPASPWPPRDLHRNKQHPCHPMPATAERPAGPARGASTRPHGPASSADASAARRAVLASRPLRARHPHHRPTGCRDRRLAQLGKDQCRRKERKTPRTRTRGARTKPPRSSPSTSPPPTSCRRTPAGTCKRPRIRSRTSRVWARSGGAG